MDGLFELILVRNPGIDLYQGIFSTFPDINEYSMNDLYERHPDPAKPFLYKWVGRADDVIVLSNGEKLAPALMEASLLSVDIVKGAMVVGRGKFEPAALLDLGDTPHDTPAERIAIMKELQPGINEANRHAPAHGQLAQYHILFADKKRPIYYLGQGKIQRNQTYRLYEKDIEENYEEAENEELDLGEGGNWSLHRIDFTHQSSIKDWLEEFISEDADIHDLGGDDAFFEAGMDSLRVLRIVRELKHQAQLDNSTDFTTNSLNPATVYGHPSLNDLSDTLFKGAHLAPKEPGSEDHNEDVKLKLMESLLDKFVQSLPAKTERQQSPVAQGQTVLLTGSTGSLGSYLLNELTNDPNVQRVICLDRSTSAADKHRETGPGRGLTALDPERVEFLKGDLADPQLGVGQEVYERLTNTVTHILRKSTLHSIPTSKLE